MSVEAAAEPSPSVLGEHIVEIRRRNEMLTRVFGGGGSYQIWMEGLGWFYVDGQSMTVPGVSVDPWLEGILWGLPSALSVISRGDVMLHASAVEVDGRGILFAAPGGFGKTTLAALMHADGYRILSEDLIRCRLSGEVPEVFPGPAMIRLRKDVAGAVTGVGNVVATDAEKVHISTTPSRRGTGNAIPLAGIVLLRRGDQIEIRSRRPVDALSDLWAVSLNIPNDGGRAHCFNQITELASRTPVWDLIRPITFEDVPDVIDLLLSKCL